ncbi:winged helix-turn-helix transcriptional regulator [Actinomyces israelii]|uniref:winged helix-turn-helix transcriptional regulator n=1 Tax=Actinomyces israelii TaxID=1659 RepID=UPI0023578CEB|nr:helix-turn-helix domain-containing protein [Actinomyces israelii]
MSQHARDPAVAADQGGEGGRGAGNAGGTGSGGNAEGARAGGDGRSTGSGKNAGDSRVAGSGGDTGSARSARTERGPLGAPLNDYDILAPACPSRTVLRHVVDRWTPLVVAVLARGPHRFGELRAAVGGITPKVLTETLRSMERDGLVTRDQAPGVPPRVDYALTPLGTTLAEPMGALRAWAEGHAEEVLGNRARYDAVVRDGAR